MIHFQQATFLLSAVKLQQLPEDIGYEIAFVGRSNAGKSLALNAITQQKKLAKVSKRPGRTRQMNVFLIDELHRLIDLPGYGFAKTPKKMRLSWQKLITQYLETRESLKGLILLMDSRHPLKALDVMLIDWCLAANLHCHIVLTKCDKLNNQKKSAVLRQVKDEYKESELISTQLFSATKLTGLDKLTAKASQWMQPRTPVAEDPLKQGG